MKFRVTAVQYHLRSIASFDEFAAQVTHYIRIAEEQGAEFVLFPELFTTQLLSIPDKRNTTRPISALLEYTDRYRKLFVSLAKAGGLHIVGGTHVVVRHGRLYNVAFLFHPDGRIDEQPKVHVTPTEIKEWGFASSEGINVFETAIGTVALLTCYDIEFPEIVRMTRAKGANVIFCPSCTDDRHGFHRVRYCCHARAVENQVYVVTTGTVGSLPTVDFMRANVGQAAIITPNDIPFPPRGIMAEGELNNDMVVTADLDLDLLHEVREKGTVTTWRDRRTDLYPDWR